MENNQMENNQMENNQMELKGMKRVWWLFSLFLVMGLSIFLWKNISFANSQTTQTHVPLDKVFVCDSCDLNQAIAITKEQALQPQCIFTQEPGVAPTPDDVDCQSSPRVVMIVNPNSQQSFKFNVEIVCHGTWCENGNPTFHQLELTQEEHEDITAFFDFHNRLRAAVHAATNIALPNQGINDVDWTDAELGVMTSYSYATANCEGHPVLFFTNNAWRNALYRMMATEISMNFGSSSFESGVTSAAFNGLTLGDKQIGVSWEYNTHDLWNMVEFKGSWDNRLNFRVTYEGNISHSGVIPNRLRFTLAPATSAIGGVLVSDLLNGFPLNLEDEGDIGCLSLLFNNPLFYQPVSLGEPETIPDFPGDNSGDKVVRCLKTVRTSACITDEDGSRQCLPQTVSFWEMCPVEFP